jgi:hypothetical protein
MWTELDETKQQRYSVWRKVQKDMGCEERSGDRWRDEVLNAAVRLAVIDSTRKIAGTL